MPKISGLQTDHRIICKSVARNAFDKQKTLRDLSKCILFLRNTKILFCFVNSCTLHVFTAFRRVVPNPFSCPQQIYISRIPNRKFSLFDVTLTVHRNILYCETNKMHYLYVFIPKLLLYMFEQIYPSSSAVYAAVCTYHAEYIKIIVLKIYFHMFRLKSVACSVLV